MPRYVDGFVIPMPKKSIEAYRKMAKLGARVWMDHGALEYRECIGEDLNTKMGTPYTKSHKVKPTETVVFAWIVFKSRAHRDRVNAAVMKDHRIAGMMDAGQPMPFDPKRMSYGGFEILVEAR